MIVVTGGAGFIGSAFVWALNKKKITDILIVDSLGEGDKWKNLRALRFADYLEKEDFLEQVIQNNLQYEIEAIVHLGACSDTTEQDASYLIWNNYEYTKHIASFAINSGIRFVYASSAATYGDGAEGYVDDEKQLDKLRPLNMYGYSKQLFDQWAYRRGYLDKIAGLKFFNVFGPNEYHKGEMRSVVLRAFEQIRDSGTVKLFKSYKKEYKNGEQKRDFIYVKDAVDIIMYFLDNPKVNGIYNVGAGKAETWNSLAKAVFSAYGKKPLIKYIDMPKDLRPRYQYFTEADMKKLRKAGYKKKMTSLEDAISDYVKSYLINDEFLSV